MPCSSLEQGSESADVQDVDSRQTKNALSDGLPRVGHYATFRLQGSVPLNVHIRGVSDVDLLTLETTFYTYDTAGSRSRSGGYTEPTTRTSIGVLSSLRLACERILKDSYPAADVNTSGGKAISISGGSLARPVDVVPSHWHDNAEYQNSRLERDRGVTILNKKVPTTIDNLPFLHIDRVHSRDANASGGLKKSIRLCKNVKNDAIEERRSINFPSFDIAATIYHASMANLQIGSVYELAVLAETQRFLDELYHNPEKTKSLLVPDGSRRIFDTDEKYNGMKALSLEMDDLAKEVAKEQGVVRGADGNPSLSDSRDTLVKSYVS